MIDLLLCCLTEASLQDIILTRDEGSFWPYGLVVVSTSASNASKSKAFNGSTHEYYESGKTTKRLTHRRRLLLEGSHVVATAKNFQPAPRKKRFSTQ
jgi:hypothetical protein